MGGKLGRRMSPTSFPPMREQINTVMMPKRLPPGRHSFLVMDQTTPNTTAAMDTATQTHAHSKKNIHFALIKIKWVAQSLSAGRSKIQFPGRVFVY